MKPAHVFSLLALFGISTVFACSRGEPVRIVDGPTGGAAATGGAPSTGGASTGGDSPGGAGGGEPGGPRGLLLDDFEDGDGESSIGTGWFVYDDQGEGGGSELTIPKDGTALSMTGPGFESQVSLSCEFTFDQGDLTYEPFVGLGVDFDEAHTDLGSYAGLRYTYRGDAHEVRIETSNVADYDYHAVQIPASPDWRTVELPFSDFIQGGWGETVPFGVESSERVSWHIRGATGESGTFLLDEVWIVSELTDVGPRVPTLEIRPASPPEKTVLESVAITHPLFELSKSLDRGANITNFLEQARFDGYGDFGEPYVEKLAAAGFLSLRLPIDLDLYVVDESWENDRPSLVLHDDLFAILDDYEAWTRTHGLSLTIDYHQYDESFDIEDPASTARFTELWRRVAEHFAASERRDLFFELMNEPELFGGAGAPSAGEWGELAETTIAAIREHAPDRPVIFGDVEWYGIDALVRREPLSDPNVIYAVHFYDPFIFTHQGASWADMAATHDIPFPYSEEAWTEYQEDFGFSELSDAWHLSQLESYYRNGTKNALFNRIAQAKAWAVEHDVPLILNEFGVYEARSKPEDRVRYYTDLNSIFNELEIPWQIWFSIMDPETGEVADGLDGAFGL